MSKDSEFDRVERLIDSLSKLDKQNCQYLSFAQRIITRGKKEAGEGLTPMPTTQLWQMAVADWRQPFVPFNPSCGIYNSSEARTRKCRQHSCERLRLFVLSFERVLNGARASRRRERVWLCRLVSTPLGRHRRLRPPCHTPFRSPSSVLRRPRGGAGDQLFTCPLRACVKSPSGFT